MAMTWWHYGVWIVAGAGLGFAQAFLLADQLRLSRRKFLIFYAPITAVFLYSYARWTGQDVAASSTTNPGIGIVVALLGGAFLVKNVLSQPSSARSRRGQLAVDILWVGGIYGILDALLLSVLPVHATWQALAVLGLRSDLVAGALPLVASLVVTVAYHVGYSEFRGPKQIIGPVIGNGVCSLVYLLSGNLLAPVLAHIAMHVAAVFHGPDTTIQLPPHYPETIDTAKPVKQRP